MYHKQFKVHFQDYGVNKENGACRLKKPFLLEIIEEGNSVVGSASEKELPTAPGLKDMFFAVHYCGTNGLYQNF